MESGWGRDTLLTELTDKMNIIYQNADAYSAVCGFDYPIKEQIAAGITLPYDQSGIQGIF